jgi:TonB family protein
MTGQRLTFSILLAILFHAAVLLLLQLFLKLAPERMPEYSGPMFVTLEESPESPVLERVQEPQAQPRVEPAPQPAAQTEQPRTQAATRVEQPSAAVQPQAQPRTTPAPAQPQPRTETQPAPQPGTRTEPLRQPQGSRQVVPAEPLGTLPPVASEETTPYQPQTFSQPLQEQGPILAAPSREQASRLDTSRLDSAIAQADTGGTVVPQTGPNGASTGPAGAAQTSVEGFQIEWQNPSEGRLVLQSGQPEIPGWVSEQGLRLQVAVSFVLKPSGYLSDIRIARSSGYSDVDTAVVSALRRFRFSASPGAPDVHGEVTYRIIPR